MSKVYGELSSDIGQGSKTRRGHAFMQAVVKTWNGSCTVRIRPDESIDVWINNLDVRLNGISMHRRRREEHEIPMEDLLDLVEKRFKVESGKYARLPKKEFKAFKDLMTFHKIVEKLEVK